MRFPTEEVLVCQTGLIGIPFPIDAVLPEIGDIVMARNPSTEAAASASRPKRARISATASSSAARSCWIASARAAGSASSAMSRRSCTGSDESSRPLTERPSRRTPSLVSRASSSASASS